MTPRPLRICLILHSTRSDNLGVGALTVAEVEILRRIGRALDLPLEITVMDWKDPRAPYVTGPDIRVRDLDGRVMLDPRGYFAIARRSDLVIDIGGGDSFADIYGGRRLRRMFVLKFLTHLAGTPLVMAPQTIGPFHKRWSSWLAQITMRRAAILATRDARSTQAVRDMGLTRAVVEASDVALRLPYDLPADRAGEVLRVGLNVSGLLMAGGYTGRNELGIALDYPALMRGLIAAFQARGAEVHLVPHVIVPEGRMTGEDDYRASVALAAETPGVIVAPAFATPSEAKTYIAGLDFFAGARMHACIAAFSSGVPVVPLAYSRKFAGLFGTLGYDHTIDCTTVATADAQARVLAAFDARDTLKAEAAAALQSGLDRLAGYEAAVTDLIRKIRPREPCGRQF